MSDKARLANVPAATLAHLDQLFDDAYPERLREVATCLYLELLEADELVALLGAPRCAQIALDQTERLSFDLGGESFYMHRGTRYRLSLRDRKIVAEFNGHNQHALARQYQLSTVRIYQIISAWRDEEFARRQGRLALDDGDA